ncbi:hypothetical protein LJR255_000612 [Pararhizobium sp. LjRoot255]|uniref:hypothetical protein n=1 Tax=Pararhizobium sp. LjRoot255 TaxID=3342298 RepID=UPI003ED08836
MRKFIPLHNSLNRNRFKGKVMQQIQSATASVACLLTRGAVGAITALSARLAKKKNNRDTELSWA